MKIVITGASGFVAGLLIPRLASRGVSMLLVGRDPQKLAARYPDLECCGYEELGEKARGCDLLVNLAVRNNDMSGSQDAFDRVNVTFMQELAEKAAQAGIPRFINLSSTHALDDKNLTPYAISKRRAAMVLADITGIEGHTLYLPAVYTPGQWAGRLGVLNNLPEPVASLAFSFVSALKPTLNADRLADHLVHGEFNQHEQIIVSDGQGGNLVYRFVRRLGDLAFAVVVLGLFWWALLLIWLAVKLQSPGPGLFAQTRIGRHGKPFTCYKFRTMSTGTIEAATHEVSASAVTPFGHFLRRTKIDELPQAINLLLGNMTLIGPRPCLPKQSELIAERQKRGVFDIKPGISGLAQVNDIDMSDPKKLARWDARYKALQGLVLDVKLALATVLGRGAGDRTSKSPK